MRSCEKLAEKIGIFDNVMIAMARVLAAKPNSCDFERLISSCNLMKIPSKNSLDIKTQNLHLDIYYSMPSLGEFDPRPVDTERLKKGKASHRNTKSNGTEIVQRNC